MDKINCTLCGKELTDENDVNVKWFNGMQYFYCAECNKKLKEENKTSSLDETIEEEKSQKHVASIVFIVIDCIVGLIGFILGIVCGNTYPIITVEKYESILNGTITENVENFNTPLMWYVWIATAILLCILIGITVIIRNQEKLMTYLKNRKD